MEKQKGLLQITVMRQKKYIKMQSKKHWEKSYVHEPLANKMDETEVRIKKNGNKSRNCVV